MTEGLVQFQNKICKKAMKAFQETEEVSFDDFLKYVNMRTGTELHENFVEIFYQHFLKLREEAKNPPAQVN
jgi:hypothetical protein